MKNKILYIGGYGRSGSTILDAFLSRQLNATGVGECVNFWDEYSKDFPCECGKSYSNCEFWCNFFNQFSSAELTSAFSSTRKADSGFGIDQTYIEFWKSFLDYTFKISSSSVIIDSSKTTSKTAFRPSNLERIGYDVYFIFLYKKPEQLLVSLRKGSNKQLDNKKKDPPRFLFLTKSFLGWFYATIMSTYLSRKYKKKSIIIRHDKFSENPTKILNEIAMKFSIRMKDSSNNHTNLFHGISGNRVRQRIKYDQDIIITTSKSEEIILLSVYEKIIYLSMRATLFVCGTLIKEKL